MNKWINIIFTLTLFIGLVFALLPHAYHEGLGFVEKSHETHMFEGLGVFILSLIVLVINNKAFRIPNFNKKNKNKKS